MCLTIDKAKFKIETTQEDIVVYKVLKEYGKDVASPYQDFIYEIGKKYKTKMKIRLFYSYYEIAEGFHSFLNEEDAEYEKKDIQHTLNCDFYRCFRCIIPNGSKIVYGKYGNTDAVVSDTIKIIEEV